MAEKEISGFRRFLNALFNICWIILGGLANAIGCIVSGVLSCVLIIPIFFGIPKVYFRLIPLVFAPAGKRVRLHFAEAPVRNVFYWIFLGFVNAILGYIWGLVLCITLIGIPLGLQQFKFAKYYLAPFKAEVVKL